MMNKFEQPTAMASDIASKTTWGGAGTSVMGSFIQVDWVTWIGMLIALAGLAVNIYFKIREDRRAAELHQMKLRQQQGRCCNQADKGMECNHE